MWDVTWCISQDHWLIDILVGCYSSEDEAKRVAEQCSQAKLVIHHNQYAFELMVDGEPKYYFDENIPVLELTPEKRAMMGQPLDMDIKENADIAVRALLENDPRYVIHPADMIPSSIKIEHLVIMYGFGYTFSPLASGIIKVE